MDLVFSFDLSKGVVFYCWVVEDVVQRCIFELYERVKKEEENKLLFATFSIRFLRFNFLSVFLTDNEPVLECRFFFFLGGGGGGGEDGGGGFKYCLACIMFQFF